MLLDGGLKVFFKHLQRGIVFCCCTVANVKSEANLGVNLSELDSTVQCSGLFTGESISLMVAGQSGLVKDGSISADEAPVSGLDNLTGVVLNGQADVEDLAAVGDIGVVSVGLSFALEAGLEGGLEEGLGICGEGVGEGSGGGVSTLGGRVGEGCQDSQSCNSGHGDGKGKGLVAHHGEVRR